MKRSGLGRGLDVLLPQNDELFQTVVQEIAIDDIDPNTAQPRKDFDKEALEQLAETIRSAGVLSPILVVQDGMRYRIVAGERRYRASRLAGSGLSTPCSCPSDPSRARASPRFTRRMDGVNRSSSARTCPSRQGLAPTPTGSSTTG